MDSTEWLEYVVAVFLGYCRTGIAYNKLTLVGTTTNVLQGDVSVGGSIFRSVDEQVVDDLCYVGLVNLSVHLRCVNLQLYTAGCLSAHIAHQCLAEYGYVGIFQF